MEMSREWKLEEARTGNTYGRFEQEHFWDRGSPSVSVTSTLRNSVREDKSKVFLQSGTAA